MQFNLYILILILIALLSTGLAYVAYRKRSAVGSLELSGLMFAVSIWTIANAAEAAMLTVQAKIFWSVGSYLGSQTSPVFFFLFIVAYIRQDREFAFWKKTALFLIPFGSFLVAATNSIHRFLWPNVALAFHPYLGWVGIYQHGPWFWVEVTYAYILLLLGTILLVRSMLLHPHVFGNQYRIILISSIAPWLINLIYAIKPEILFGTDMTPLAFFATGGILFWAVLRQRLLDVVPIANNELMKFLQEGILLTDRNAFVIDANPAAQKFLNLVPPFLNKSIDEIFSGQPEIISFFHRDSPESIEAMIHKSPSKIIQMNKVSLHDRNQKQIGYLTTLIDISDRKKAENALRESEERYRLLVENQSEGIIIVDNLEIFHFANPAAERIFGVEQGTLVGKNLLWFIPEDQIPLLINQIARRYAGERSVYEIDIVRADGVRRTVEINGNPYDIKEPDLYATFGIVRDISERKQDELALIHTNAILRERERFLGLLNDVSRAALEAADLDTLLQTIADHLATLFTADTCYITLWDETQQRTIPTAASGPARDTYRLDRGDPEELTMTYSVLSAGHALVAEDVFNSPYMSPNIARNYPTKSLMGLPLIASGRKLGAALIGYDQHHSFSNAELSMGEQAAGQLALAVLKALLLLETDTANRKLQQALESLDRLATTDKLTGAYNRYKFDELIIYEINRLDRYHHPVSLILFDIDHFKEINDTFGHHSGDIVLIEVARLVRENIRGVDSLIRWGGDEFLILAPDTGCLQAMSLADKIRAIVAQHLFPDVSTNITISVGVTELKMGEAFPDPLRRVDLALYTSKHGGRDRVEML